MLREHYTSAGMSKQMRRGDMCTDRNNLPGADAAQRTEALVTLAKAERLRENAVDSLQQNQGFSRAKRRNMAMGPPTGRRGPEAPGKRYGKESLQQNQGCGRPRRVKRESRCTEAGRAQKRLADSAKYEEDQ